MIDLEEQEHFRRLERMYHGANINAFFKPDLHINDEGARVNMTVRDDFHHAAHAMHGAVYFKMLDDAAFFAANAIVRDVFVLTVNFNLVLLRPVVEGIISAHATVVHKSRNLIVAESELVDERGKGLARGTGTFMRSSKALNADIGYR